MSTVTLENLRHVYSRGTPFEKTALENISLEIPSGQFVGLIGHTGSGKSTLIQHMNGLLKPSEGRVLLDGEDIFESKENLRRARFRVGLVFQYPEYQLFEESVFKDIAFGPKNMKLSEEEVDLRVREAAGFAGVSEELFERSPLELSGGQKRRIAIAGVIAMRPEILILDEPSAGLDPAGRESILGNITQYHEKTGSTVILVSHNMEEIARIADRLVVMRGGSVAMDGTPREVFSRTGELEKMGLTVPQSAEISQKLREMGLLLPEGIFTTDALERALLALEGGGKSC